MTAQNSLVHTSSHKTYFLNINPPWFSFQQSHISQYTQVFTLNALMLQAQDSGLGESVCTLYEIHSGEENESQGQ